VQELEEEKEDVQKRLVGVRSAASHAARHSKLQQERPALQQAVIAASAACDAHKAEVCVLPSSDRNKSTPLRVHGFF
jgi:Tfp pilus assembly protein PilN